MSLQTIESKDLTLGQLFNDFYVVPSYQREYVWEEKHVEQLLQDVHTEYAEGEKEKSEYFIGSIVVLRTDEGVYELIDGQQRMTTTFLTLCALRDHLRSIDSSISVPALDGQIAGTDINEFGENVFRYRVSLQYEDSSGVLELIAAEPGSEDEITEKTRSTENILNAYQLIRTFLRNEFGSDEAVVRKFYAYFTRNIKLIRVQTVSVTHALKVFETINDRGAGLDSMDLLKNLMFMQASKEKFEVLKELWKQLVDTLHRAKEKPLRFLRYFIFARYDVDRLKEEQIYEWFSKNASLCGYKEDPVGFVKELLGAAKAFVLFGEGKNLDGSPNRYLTNIRFLSGAARQHLILLLAAKEASKPVLTELSKELENLFFAYIISREPTRDFERNFARWSRDLRKVRTEAELEQFVRQYFAPAKEELAPRFALAMKDLREDALQKYRLRYVLAKLTQHIDESAEVNPGAHQDLGTYIRGPEIEHVLPQTPLGEDVVAFDGIEQYRDYLHRLGNLALLEKAINSSISNENFTAKRPKYRNSKYLLTRSLGEKIHVGTNTAIDRAARKLDVFETWGAEAIERRQEMLTRLAHEIWDVPAVGDTEKSSAMA